MKKHSFWKNIFSFRDIDSHYKLTILGARMSFRHKMRVRWPEVTAWGLHAPERSPRLIASLTSIPPRMPTLHKVLATLLTQRCKPDMLQLWLSVEEFPNREADLPESVLRLRQYGLSLKWCTNTRSYKKLFPALLEYPEDIIVTFDDDTFYAPDVLENLYNAYVKHPNEVHAYRAGRIRIGADDKIVAIHNKELMESVYPDASFLNILISGAGTLFPPHSLYKDILDEGVFMKLLPTHDEIFFWAMSVMAGTRTRVTMGFDYPRYAIQEAQKHALNNINRRGAGGIDGRDALALMLETYPQMLPLLKAEDENK